VVEHLFAAYRSRWRFGTNIRGLTEVGRWLLEVRDPPTTFQEL
jgi:hypothetical protein